MSDGAGGDHAGDRAHMFIEVPAEAGQLGRTGIEVLLGERHLHREHVLRIQPRIDAQQPRDAFDHEPGAAKHYQRQRHFRRHKRVTQMAASALSRSAAAFLERLVHVATQGAERRRQAEQNTGQTGSEQGKCEDPAVDSDGIDLAQRKVEVIKPENMKQQFIAPGREEQAGKLVGKAREQAVAQLAPQKDLVAGTIGAVASALREASRQMREQDETTMFAGCDCVPCASAVA